MRYLSFATLLLGAALLPGIAVAASANYNFIISSSASYTVYQYDTPTDTASISGPWLSPTSTTRGTMTGTATATASSQVATSYVGTTLGSPTYAEVECGFQITGGAVNADGTCTPPTPSAFITHGAGSAPHCYASQATKDPTKACTWNINFTYAP